MTGSVLALGSDGSTASLELTWTGIGAYTDRTSLYPEYATGFTNNVSNAVLAAAAPIHIYRFDPVAYEPQEPANVIRFIDRKIISWQSPEARLDALNADVGYTATVQTIMASWQDEQWTIDQQFTRDNTAVTYAGTGRLIFPAKYELDRSWALFTNARGADRDQYKRTVYLTQIRGRVWVLQDVIPKFRGAEFAYWYSNLIPMSDATMGNLEYYNPFALTYENENNPDRPYAMFPYRCENLRPLLNELNNTL